MSFIVTRFAPSPTGRLHVGNIRMALINWLYSKQHQGKFILRIDDSDSVRSDKKFVQNIIDDLKWIGLEWNLQLFQSERKEIYNQIVQQLIDQKFLYPCYETEEELHNKRQKQLKLGKPPKYDRESLFLTNDEKEKLIQSGRKPHYRFFVKDENIQWVDLIQGTMSYEGKNLSDPIIVKEDGTLTYMLSSVVDDVLNNVTHIFRGADHVSNTALQIQLFQSLKYKIPQFGHMGLLQTGDGKISKRLGGYEIHDIKDKVEPIALISFLITLGSSQKMQLFNDIFDVIQNFNIDTFSSGSVICDLSNLYHLNAKLIRNYSYEEIQKIINFDITPEFWSIISNNIDNINDISIWWNIYTGPIQCISGLNLNIIASAYDNLHYLYKNNEIKPWIMAIKNDVAVKNKDIYSTIRLVLTGKQDGPELKDIVQLFGQNKVVERFQQYLLS